MLELVPSSPAWDVPHRLHAAVQWLVLNGEVEDYRRAPSPWDAFRAVLAERGEWIAAFVREHTVQTNEVQRCFALLPLFLSVARWARRPLDLLELGPSAGLNLCLDRYRYRYTAREWGPRESPLELTGEERSPVPRSLLETELVIRRRRGIDLDPVDVMRDDGVLLLRAFVDEDDVRLRQLHAAVEVFRRNPPELIRGDYLELLPELLRERDEGALTLVFQTLSTIYLPVEERGRVRSALEEAAREGPLAWVSTPTPEEHGQRRGDYPLELALWPGGGPRIVARMDNRGTWLEWGG